MKTILADKRSYSSKIRNRKDALFIAIHGTSNKGDTAENNGNYFKDGAYTWKTKEDGTKVKVPLNVGAHFFVDQKGNVVKSIYLNRSAWAVGGDKWNDCNVTGGGKLYNVATNYNSVSIELCDIVDKEPSDQMISAIWRTIKYIRKHCPNAQTIIRHFDVNGKHCPSSMMSEDAWNKFQLRLLAEALK